MRLVPSLLLVLGIIAAGVTGPAAAATSPEIWFAPNNSGFLADAAAAGQWRQARSRIRVYKFYYQVIDGDSTETLRRKFDLLRASGIAVAVEWPALTWEEQGPGYQVEGFAPAGFTEKLLAKIKAAGGQLDYVAIDEALYFGHYQSGEHRPQWPIDDLARRAAVNLRPVWKAFPRAKVGDIEPMGQMGAEHHQDLLREWIGAFKRHTGHALAFLHYDVLWGSDWTATAAATRVTCQSRGVRYGVIFNAEDGLHAGDRWVQSARQNVDLYLSRLAAPDDAVFQSWDPDPKVVLPEDDDNAHVSLINHFAAARRRLQGDASAR